MIWVPSAIVGIILGVIGTLLWFRKQISIQLQQQRNKHQQTLNQLEAEYKHRLVQTKNSFKKDYDDRLQQLRLELAATQTQALETRTQALQTEYQANLLQATEALKREHEDNLAITVEELKQAHQLKVQEVLNRKRPTSPPIAKALDPRPPAQPTSNLGTEPKSSNVIQPLEEPQASPPRLEQVPTPPTLNHEEIDATENENTPFIARQPEPEGTERAESADSIVSGEPDALDDLSLVFDEDGPDLFEAIPSHQAAADLGVQPEADVPTLEVPDPVIEDRSLLTSPSVESTDDALEADLRSLTPETDELDASATELDYLDALLDAGQKAELERMEITDSPSWSDLGDEVLDLEADSPNDAMDFASGIESELALNAEPATDELDLAPAMEPERPGESPKNERDGTSGIESELTLDSSSGIEPEIPDHQPEPPKDVSLIAADETPLTETAMQPSSTDEQEMLSAQTHLVQEIKFFIHEGVLYTALFETPPDFHSEYWIKNTPAQELGIEALPNHLNLEIKYPVGALGMEPFPITKDE